jgi:hypothetical protein
MVHAACALRQAPTCLGDQRLNEVAELGPVQALASCRLLLQPCQVLQAGGWQQGALSGMLW